MTIDNNILRRVVIAPGLSSLEEITQVKDWLETFNNDLKIYKEIFGEPVGVSVDMKINDLAWYQKFHSDKK